MKILKHGKVEQRKFVCPKCECEFVANAGERQLSTGYYVRCPCCQDRVLWWDEGEPYKEPTHAQVVEADRKRLQTLIRKWDNCRCGGIPEAAQFFLNHGVTFRGK